MHDPDAILGGRSEEQLLTELGRELLGTGIGFGSEDPDRLRRFAQGWIERNREKIRAAICDDPTLRELFQRDLADRLTEAATVLDALSALAGRPAVSLLSTILLRRGFDGVCGGSSA
jgi:hypothetical protein